MVDVSGIEYKSGLFLFYVVIMSKYFEDMISCDLQRYMERSIIPRHIVAFMTAFFTIVLTEYGNDDSEKSMVDYLKTTVIIYLLFLFSTKAKAEFVFPMLILLMGDQILKVYKNNLEKKSKDKEKNISETSTQTIELVEYVRSILSYSIIGIIGVGSFSYLIRQYLEFGSEFSFFKYILGTFKCNMGLNNNRKN